MKPTLPLWLIPLSYVALSLLVATLFPPFENDHFLSYSRGMSVSSDQAFLASVASGMMSLTAIVFSIAFLIVQFSASAYSKRLVLLFGRDPILFNSLGIFIATFVYALGALFYVDRDHNGRVPYFSTLLVVVLLAASVIFLALLVHRMSQLQITHVLRIVGDNGRRAIREAYRQDEDAMGRRRLGPEQRAEQIRAGSLLQTLYYSGQPRAVVSFDIPAFVRLAQDSAAVIVMECAVGDTVPDGGLLLRVFGTGHEIPEDSLVKAIHFAWDRPFTRDPKYPLRLLVDAAIMALSPAVNDPTTAVQSLDQIEDLVHRLGLCELDVGYATDASGDLRLTFPVPTWDDYLSLAFDEIRLCGGDSLQVLRRLRSALGDLSGSLADPARANAIRQYLHHVDDGIAHSNLDAMDRMVALQHDRQGLGLRRE